MNIPHQLVPELSQCPAVHQEPHDTGTYSLCRFCAPQWRQVKDDQEAVDKGQFR